jgi:hypothetical protein
VSVILAGTKSILEMMEAVCIPYNNFMPYKLRLILVVVQQASHGHGFFVIRIQVPGLVLIKPKGKGQPLRMCRTWGGLDVLLPQHHAAQRLC